MRFSVTVSGPSTVASLIGTMNRSTVACPAGNVIDDPMFA